MTEHVVRRVEGFVATEPINLVEADPRFAVDFIPAEAGAVYIPQSALVEAGASYDVVPETEGIVVADVDIYATTLNFPEDVSNLQFKGWLPGLDEPFQW